MRKCLLKMRGTCLVVAALVWQGSILSHFSTFAYAQAPQDRLHVHDPAVLALRVRTASELTPAWTIEAGELRETVAAVWGVLRVRNDSGVSASGTKFYAEYFDGIGRPCFTLVYTAEENDLNDRSAFQPGQTRNLLSLAVGPTPAVTPVEVRVYLLGQTTQGEQPISGGIIRSPVTVAGGLTSTTLFIDKHMVDSGSGVADLVFAEVEVDERGWPRNVKHLASRFQSAVDWFYSVLKSPRFNPAGIGPQNTPGTVLVLIRAIRDPEHSSPLPARGSEWVKAYVRGIGQSAVPPVYQLLFYSQDTEGAGVNGSSESENSMLSFYLVSAGDGWSSNIFHWERDARSKSPVRIWNSFEERRQ